MVAWRVSSWAAKKAEQTAVSRAVLWAVYWAVLKVFPWAVLLAGHSVVWRDDSTAA
jgi:hypothetical protein